MSATAQMLNFIEDFDKDSTLEYHQHLGLEALPNIAKATLSYVIQEGLARRISFFYPFISSKLCLEVLISIEHKLKGPNLSSVTACAAGTHAIIEATKTIMLGCADRMLVVGAESAICGAGIGGFASMNST